MQKIVTSLFHNMQTSDVKHYAKALLEPFHPDSALARVPQIIPRLTIAYSSFVETTFSGSQKILALANFQV